MNSEMVMFQGDWLGKVQEAYARDVDQVTVFSVPVSVTAEDLEADVTPLVSLADCLGVDVKKRAGGMFLIRFHRP